MQTGRLLCNDEAQSSVGSRQGYEDRAAPWGGSTELILGMTDMSANDIWLRKFSK